MQSSLYNLEYKKEIRESVETTTLIWRIFDFHWLLNSQTNRQICTRDNDYEKDIVEERRRYHLKVVFCGSTNCLVELYYRVPVNMNVKVVLHMWSKNLRNFNAECSKDYHWVESNKWQLLTTLSKQHIINDKTSTDLGETRPCVFKVFFLVRCNDTNSQLVKQLPSITGPQLNDEMDDENTKSYLINDLTKLYNDLSFSDITVLSNNGVEFKAHKAILAARSNVLDAHFKHNTVESVTNVVKTHLDTEVLQEVINYIYTDNVPRIADIPEKLLMAAEFYQMNGLKRICEDALSKKLSLDNAIEILELAHLHGANHLKEQTLEFISDGLAKEITHTEGWEKLNSVELLKSLYKYNISH